MLGRPKFKRDDKVCFEWNGILKTGSIFIVDAYGTFFQADEPSYDVMVEADNCLYKHLLESAVRSLGQQK